MISYKILKDQDRKSEFLTGKMLGQFQCIDIIVIRNWIFELIRRGREEGKPHYKADIGSRSYNTGLYISHLTSE